MKRRAALAILSLMLGAMTAPAEEAAPAQSAAAKAPVVREPELRAELLRRVKVDQDARMAITSWMKQFGPPVEDADFETKLDAGKKAEYRQLADTVLKADAENKGWLRKILDRHGWPTTALVGKDGANAAWLLVQHADTDRKLQRRCLDLMSRAPAGEVSRTDVAYLTDRVLLAEGRKQIYGTQVTFQDGRWQPRPLEDPANVDKRRAEAGMSTLAEYVKDLESVYGAASKK